MLKVILLTMPIPLFQFRIIITKDNLSHKLPETLIIIVLLWDKVTLYQWGTLQSKEFSQIEMLQKDQFQKLDERNLVKNKCSIYVLILSFHHNWKTLKNEFLLHLTFVLIWLSNNWLLQKYQINDEKEDNFQPL